MMTYKGPMWVPYGLKFYMGPTWVQFGHHALILPIWDPFAHACWGGCTGVYIIFLMIALKYRLKVLINAVLTCINTLCFEQN